MVEATDHSGGGYLLLSTAAGRVIYCSGSLRLLLGEDLTGRNLNDFLEDQTTAQIVAAALRGESLDFGCTLERRRFSAFAESVAGNICVTFYPLDENGTPTFAGNTAGLVVRELNAALHTMFLALGEIRPQLIGEAREDGAVLAQNLYRLLRLSHNLSDCADAERGLLRLHVTEEDAVRLCGGLAQRLEGPCRSRGVRLRWEAPAEPIVFRGDREKIERMLLNLIANALAAQKDGGEVTLAVAAAEAEDEVVFTVMDSGPGVADTGSLFRKYRLADPADGASMGGAGFGLALTYAFARLHGGQVLYSGGSGAAFQIRLPRNLQGVLAPLGAAAQDYAGGIDRVLLELATVLGKENY